MMTQPRTLHDVIIGVFNEGIERDLKAQEAVRDEIKQHGTWWAGSEIWELRRQVASLRRRISELEQAADA
jgi:hypothetical protein